MMSENNNDTNDQFGDIPPHIKEVIFQFLLDAHTGDIDVSVPHIRKSFEHLFNFVICMYGLLIITGVISNSAVLYYIFRRRLYEDATYCFIINNSVSDIVKCIGVLPITLYVLVVQNWRLGEPLCSFLPMLQDLPLHATTLTFLLIAWDRLRYVRRPNRPRLPTIVCTVGTWLTSFCLVLPYPIYIIYIDLGKHIPSLNGIGICVVNFTDDMLEYMRGIFLLMYTAPLSTISYLYIKASRELEVEQVDLGVMFEARREGRSRTDSHTTTIDIRNTRRESDQSQQSRASRMNSRPNVRMPERMLMETNDELIVPKEKRTQKYLGMMVTVYAMCICPLMVLRVARLVLIETYDNTSKFDIFYTVFVWIAFIPTCATPFIFLFWQMNRSTKERLQGCFRSSKWKLRQSCETVVTTASTPALLRVSRNTSTSDGPLQHHYQHQRGTPEGHSDTSSLHQPSS